MEIEADIAVLVEGSVAQAQLLQTLTAELAEVLDINVYDVQITGVRQTWSGGNMRRLETAMIEFDFVIRSANPAVALAQLESQLADENSQLRTSYTLGTVDSNKPLAFAFTCGVGLHRPAGASDCRTCNANMYPDPNDGTRCEECEHPMAVNADKSGCHCADDYYDARAGVLVCYEAGQDWTAADFPVRAPGDEQCLPCNDGNTATNCLKPCRGGLASVAPGFTAISTVAHPTAGVIGLLAIFECPLKEGCPGQNSTSIEMSCAKGYMGTLCAVCDEQHSRSGEKCIPCQAAAGSVALVVALVVAAVVAALITRCCLSTKRKVFDGEQTAERQATEYAYGGGLIVQGKILIGLLQVITELPLALSLTFPPAFASLVQAIRVLMLDVFALLYIDCLGGISLHGKFVAIMAAPWVCVAFIRLIQSIADHQATRELAPSSGYRKKVKKSFEAGENIQCPHCEKRMQTPTRANFVACPGCAITIATKDIQIAQPEHETLDDITIRAEALVAQLTENRNKFAYRVFFVVFLLYPLLSKTVFHMFLCQTLGPGKRWHIDDLSVDCDSDVHVAFVLVAAVCIVVYPVGIPLTFFVLLRRDERRRQRSVHVEASTDDGTLSETIDEASQPTDTHESQPSDQATTKATASASQPSAESEDTIEAGDSTPLVSPPKVVPAAQNLQDLRTTTLTVLSNTPQLAAGTTLVTTFDFLRKDFKDGYYYFECVFLLEKLILTGLIIFLDPGTLFQALCGTGVAITFLIVEIAAWPYAADQDNHLKMVAELQLVVTLLLSIVLQAADGAFADDSLGEAGYDGILVVAFFVTPLLYFAFCTTTLVRYCRARCARRTRPAEP
jgi:hypothetical protein